MPRDWIELVALVGAGATWVTTHVAVAWGLGTRRPWWRGPVALLIAPLAPYWAARERMHLRLGLWCLALLGYALAWLRATSP